MRQLYLGFMIIVLAATVSARDDFFWGSYGGYQGYFNAPYIGFGFMADSWGGEFGLQVPANANLSVNQTEPPHSHMQPVSNDSLVGLPVHLSLIKGYAPNDRIALFASFGMLLSSRCDIVESEYTGDRYCENQTSSLELIPGAGALFSMGELTLGMEYQYGIGPLLSIGTDF